MTNKMDELRVRIAELAEEAKLICHNRGLEAMDKVTIIVRDEANPNMHFVVSNDAGCSYTFWRRPDHAIDDSGHKDRVFRTMMALGNSYRNLCFAKQKRTGDDEE